MTIDLRDAVEEDIDPLARIWYEGWQDAHARLLPAELARVRTLESFRERLANALETVRTGGTPGEPLGFSMVMHDELYQLYVSAEARGTGLAAALLADAEARIAQRGTEVAWLACAIGNDRAARFYEKCGWQRAGVVPHHLNTSAGVITIEVWRYEKRLR